VATAPWLAASAGYKPQPGQINQLLAAHTSSWIYTGNSVQASEEIGSGVYVSTASQYLAQSFVTGAAQTTIGVVYLQISAVGGSAVSATISPLTVALYASIAGLPTGAPLATGTLAEVSVYLGAFWLPVPLAASGLTPSTVYQLVVSPAGSSASYFAWQQSNQTSGASTSQSGTTWTGQAYGFMYQIHDLTGTTWPPAFLVDDGGARTTAFTYNAAGQLATITEQVVSQSGAVQYSQRALTYSNGLLAGVA
jgi:YD repeat-containing protein